MNELVKSPRSDLAITSDQTFWTDKQAAALRQLGVANASNADLAVFFHQSTRTGLDPFLRQIYMIERDGKQTIQTGIDGFRLIARRAVDRTHETLGYEDTFWCGSDGEWKRVWVKDEPPHAAAVVALRNGQRFPAIALYNEYVVRVKKDGNRPNRVWAGRPAGQLEKCAEALALRKAFPQDLSGIYTSDEMREPDVPQADWSVEHATESTASDQATETVDGEAVEVGIEPRQIKRMAMLMGNQGMTDRDDALKYVALVIGHEVGSRNELTYSEASRVISSLEADVVAQ